MSTVTLSNPHCAITSAENPDGIASQAFTTALPEAQTFLTLFATLFPSFVQTSRHCEERSDEAIQSIPAVMDCFAALAMTVQIMLSPVVCSPRSRRLRGRYSLSPPRYHPARAHRFWCDRRAFFSRDRRGSARHQRRRPAWSP